MIPTAMANWPQFILYNNVKLPLNPLTFEVGDPHDPSIWVDATKAKLLHELTGYGIGFVFTDQDPFFFFDIDKCYNGSEWSPLAIQLCQAFQGCYLEVSKSGTGLHIFGIAGPQEHSCKNSALGIELYTTGRYAALTGTNATGDAAFDPGLNYPWLIDNFFPPGADTGPDTAEWTEKPSEGYSGPEDDQELIKRMLGSRSASNVFSGRASIADLWTANQEALTKCFPPIQAGPFDHSSADAALCSHLAFWTGKDCARMERLFEQSALVRDKWTKRKKYRRTTILNAVAHCQNILSNQRNKVIAPGTAATEVSIREGFQYLTVQDQIEFFKACVYVRDAHKIFVPDGGLLKPEQFKAFYGGFVFAIDTLNDKVTKDAWQVFTQSQGVSFPKVSTTCFRPECPPGSIIQEEGTSLVNTYVPIETARIPGDPSPFLEHLFKLLPDDRDRTILLSYMAACVQYPGVKFQWAPLIQGVEGNGKSMIMTIVAKAIGLRYTHKLNPKDIGNVFNAWIVNKLFISIDEVYVADRQDVIDTLKWLITEDRVPITPKGVDQVTGDNRANFMIATNPKDAIRKNKNDRRYCVFYTAQQERADNIKAGFTGKYFNNLWKWLRADGFAIMTDYLHTYHIQAEFNPAVDCQNAPDTTSTAEAVTLSLGGVEQEILAAVEEGRPGFAGGWVSSMALDRLLIEKRADRRIPRNKRKQILKDLGYIVHPALKGGRVNNAIMLDGGKPRLYIKEGHIAANAEKSGEVARLYTEAQSGTSDDAGTAEAERIFNK